MPRPKSAVPAYRHHKSTGRAVVYVNRKSIFLGKYDSSESRQRYAEIVAQITSGQPVSTSSKAPPRRTAAGPSVAALCLRFVADKLPSYAVDEQHCFRGAMRVLVELFGETPVEEFGPIRLRTVRAAMVQGNPEAIGRDGELKPRKPWSRYFVNKQIKRLRRLFRWGVSWEMVPVAIADALATVESLRAGDTEAAESRPREAVSAERLSAVRAELNPRHRDIFDLLLLTGARPGEILKLTTGIIDRTGEVWRVELSQHKTAHKGKARVLHFNATAQGILQKYLSADPEKCLFPIRRDNYGQAVKQACERAFGMPAELRKPDRTLSPAKLAEVKRQAKAWRQEHVFTPHWLRHTTATRIADDAGMDAAQSLLGHCSSAMTALYTKKAEKKAREAAKLLG